MRAWWLAVLWMGCAESEVKDPFGDVVDGDLDSDEPSDSGDTGDTSDTSDTGDSGDTGDTSDTGDTGPS